MATRLMLILGLFGLSAFGCAQNPTNCEQAACDGETQMCVLLGSDTLEPSRAVCEPILAGCEDDHTCSCLDTEIEDDSSERFCFDTGGCTVNAGVIELICPGG